MDGLHILTDTINDSDILMEPVVGVVGQTGRSREASCFP